MTQDKKANTVGGRERRKEGGRELHFCALITVDEAPSWRAE
jgi:hypothetical protein